MDAGVLLTGTAGFIGSHVAEALVARGLVVTGIDNFDPFYSPDVKRDNVARLVTHPRFTLEVGDIRDNLFVQNLMVTLRPQTVVHLAARAGVRSSFGEPLTYMDVNVRGTANLLNEARSVGVSHFVFGSSSSVYGETALLPFSESDSADRPSSPYAASKRSGELLCHAYCHASSFNVSCLRFFTVYGPRQRPDMAISKFARLMTAREPVEIYGDGTSRRDYTFVDDIVRGVLSAIDRPDGFQIYNLGTTTSTELRELVELLALKLDVPLRINELPFQMGDVPATLADITKAQDRLGYDPVTGIDTGLDRFVTWFKDRRGTFEGSPTGVGGGRPERPSGPASET